MAEIDSLKLDRELLDQKKAELIRSINSMKNKIKEKEEVIQTNQQRNLELVTQSEKLESDLKIQEQKRAKNIQSIEQLKKDK